MKNGGMRRVKEETIVVVGKGIEQNKGYHSTAQQSVHGRT
jgi:hypothetical protein